MICAREVDCFTEPDIGPRRTTWWPAMTTKYYGRMIAAPVVILLSSSVCAFAASFSA